MSFSSLMGVTVDYLVATPSSGTALVDYLVPVAGSSAIQADYAAAVFPQTSTLTDYFVTETVSALGSNTAVRTIILVTQHYATPCLPSGSTSARLTTTRLP